MSNEGVINSEQLRETLQAKIKQAYEEVTSADKKFNELVTQREALYGHDINEALYGHDINEALDNFKEINLPRGVNCSISIDRGGLPEEGEEDLCRIVFEKTQPYEQEMCAMNFRFDYTEGIQTDFAFTLSEVNAFILLLHRVSQRMTILAVDRGLIK